MKKMKSSLMLLIAAFCISACGSKGNTGTPTAEGFDEESALAEEEEMTEDEEAQPVGDRALYQVHGNVRKITFVEGCESFQRSFTPFDGAGYSAQVRQKVQDYINACTISNHVTFDRTGKSITGNAEFFTSDPIDDGGTYYTNIFYGSDPVYGGDYNLASIYGCTYTYDASGRLVGVGGIDCGESYDYDQHDRLVKKAGGGEGGYGYENVFSYDKDGNVVKEESKETEFDEGSDEVVSSSTLTYTILEKDNRGNWTKRRSSMGEVDERTISYY